MALWWFLSLWFVATCCVSHPVSLGVVPAATVEAMRAHLVRFELMERSSLDVLFLDIDETVVIPAAPFIYGLPRTDDFVSKWEASCAPQAFKRISSKMEAIYYEMPHLLVEFGWKNFLQSYSGHVVALTARSVEDNRTSALIDDLRQLGAKFSLPWFLGELDSTKAAAVNVEGVGGMIFGGSVNKGDIILDYVKHAPRGDPVRTTALVDNSLINCQAASQAISDASRQGIQHLSLHYTAAYRMDGEHDDMMLWASNIKEALGIPDQECPLLASAVLFL